MTADEQMDRDVAAVRRFNRLYTRQIGLLDKGHLRSPFSLTEVRVLYEIAHGDAPTATAICRALGIDAGYMSRMVQTFERRGLVERRVSKADARQSALALTRKGRSAFAALDARASEKIGALLRDRPAPARRRMVAAMDSIEDALLTPSDASTQVTLRPHRPGDLGWIVHRHGVLYSREYGWDERFEALVAEIVARFVQHFDVTRERCWLAERDGEILGSVMLVKESDETAKLRLLLVEPAARGLGIGTRLVDECLAFARAAGYRSMVLWTQSILAGARQIYERAGFQRTAQQPHDAFGANLIAETWEITL